MNKLVLVIPYFNNFEGLEKSLKSIDSDEELDVVIIDDGSKTKFDETKIIESFRAKGAIYFEYLKENQGIEFALNHALKICLEKKYRYIARLDCGDVCLGKRFEIQTQFLEQNPEIDIVGSNVLAVDINDDFLYAINLPQDDKKIKNKMYFNSMLIHPAIMFKSAILAMVGLYPTNHKFAEDYAFFFAISKKHKLANIPEYLTQIEINENGISIQKRRQQVKARIQIIKDNFYFGWFPVYGLFRNYVLLFTPNSLILNLKKIIKK